MTENLSEELIQEFENQIKSKEYLLNDLKKFENFVKDLIYPLEESVNIFVKKCEDHRVSKDELLQFLHDISVFFFISQRNKFNIATAKEA